MKQCRVALSFFFTALTLFLGFGLAQENATQAQGQYVRVSPDLEIYYEEVGTGDPIIFIPGWTDSSYYFRQQLNHFSESYRAISYDPRSQGRSSKTPENNNYVQRGHDLKAFMDALELKDVVLVGHTAGCKDAWAYFRAYGTENVKAFVCIEQSPKFIIEEEGGWGSTLENADLVGYHNAIAYDRLNFTRDLLPQLFANLPDEAEQNAVVDMKLMTPTSVALLLDYDGLVSDYTPEARMIDGKIPVLNVLADFGDYTEAGQAWLAENTPDAEVVVLKGGMFYLHMEFSDRFNAAVDTFLKGVE